MKTGIVISFVTLLVALFTLFYTRPEGNSLEHRVENIEGHIYSELRDIKNLVLQNR